MLWKGVAPDPGTTLAAMAFFGMRDAPCELPHALYEPGIE